MKNKSFSILIITVLLFLPILVSADSENYTLPMRPSDYTITSWFDHTEPDYDEDGLMTRYDGSQWTENIDVFNCTSGTNCYDGHNGMDYGASGGTNVHAAADGVIEQVGWFDPFNHNSGYGFLIHLWHDNYDQSTLYAHLDDDTLGILSEDEETGVEIIERGQHMAESGDTGNGGYHLHFSVFDNNSIDTAHSIDPYGWAGGGSDPWTINQGYLWTTNPPSLYAPAVVEQSVSDTISWYATYGNNPGQTFDYGYNGKLKSITVPVSWSGDGCAPELEMILSGWSNYGNGTGLGTIAISEAETANSTSKVFYTFEFNNVTLDPTIVYMFYLISTNPNGTCNPGIQSIAQWGSDNNEVGTDWRHLCLHTYCGSVQDMYYKLEYDRLVVE
jgi:murein DD-endopeptidase MepM/ murein hydrolase activator NlpD